MNKINDVEPSVVERRGNYMDIEQELKEMKDCVQKILSAFEVLKVFEEGEKKLLIKDIQENCELIKKHDKTLYGNGKEGIEPLVRKLVADMKWMKGIGTAILLAVVLDLIQKVL